MKAKDYFKEEWTSVFKIDSSSPSGLPWNIDGNNKKIGKPVGSIDSSGYWRCEYKGKSILVHRIVCHLKYEDLNTDLVVDHIDRNPLNNSPENLRMITKAQNCRNKELRKDNRTGINGVQECHFFIASWVQDGKNCSKTFSVFELGYENARNLAEELRSVKLKELNELGYNYSESHGKRV